MEQKISKKRPLIETNPYLIDPAQRDRLITRSVLTSSAVEGIYVDLPPEVHNKNTRRDENRTSAS